MPAALMTLAGLASSFTGAFAFGRLTRGPLKDPVSDFDDRLGSVTRDLENPVLDPVMGLASVLGEPWSLYPVAGLAALQFALRKRGKDAVTCMGALVGSAALNGAIKRTVKRPRPIPIIHRQSTSGSSFPSSHITMSLATYGTLALLFTRAPERHNKEERRKDRRRRVLVWVPMLLLCTLIGWSRVYQRVHHPTDVFGGWAVASVWLVACGLARSMMG